MNDTFGIDANFQPANALTSTQPSELFDAGASSSRAGLTWHGPLARKYDHTHCLGELTPPAVEETEDFDWGQSDGRAS